MVQAYKWGGIAFDDYSISKTLVLPADADDAEITFHDEVGADYQVPAGKVFIAGKLSWGAHLTSGNVAIRIGESAAAEGALTKTLIGLVVGWNALEDDDYFGTLDVVAVFAAEKYVTAVTNIGAKNLELGTTLYGIEIPA